MWGRSKGVGRSREGRRDVERNIGREELKEKMDRGDDFVLVDTMGSPYYQHSHLPGAINLPVDEVGERASELLPDRDAEIVVYCIDPP
jgi:rhodanese-related sulfurtransferase